MGHCDILGLSAMRGLGCHRQYMQPIRDTGVYSSTAPVRSGLFGVVSAFVCVCGGEGYIAGACVTSRTMVGCGRSILSKLPGMWEWGSDVLKVTVCKNCCGPDLLGLCLWS